MDVIREIYKQTGDLHHAYLLVGEREATFQALGNFLEKDLELEARGNPDFLELSYDVCGIDEARALKALTAMRSIGKNKIVVLSFDSITLEAQNSLLKIFEEPTGSTIFFVIAPSHEIFIPTLLSRFFTTAIKRGDKTAFSINVKNFLAASPKERFGILASIIEEKDKARAIHFLNSLEEIFSKKLHAATKTGEAKEEGATAETASICHEIIRCRSFLQDRSPSVKMILEHLSCIIPLS